MTGGTEPVAADGRVWWAQQWLDAVGHVPPSDTPRRRYATPRVNWRVTDLSITPGVAAARVHGPGGGPYRVTAEVPALPEDAWDAVVERLAGAVRPLARLLEGEIPDELDAVVVSHGDRLVPRELQVSCSCGRRQPCPHAGAVHEQLVERFEDDPFLLLALRGRERDDLLAAVRVARAGASPSGEPSEPRAPTVRADAAPADAAGDLAAIEVHPRTPEDPAALLRRLGPPPGVEDTEPYERLVVRAAETAWKLAAGAGSAEADEELVLAELRARRFPTAGELADALGWERDRVVELLDRLYEEGTVLRTGRDEDARYRTAPTKS